MQTEIQSGPLPLHEFPAHLLGIPEDPTPATCPNATRRKNPFAGIQTQPDPLGALRGAMYCLPIAMMMWAVIIAAIVHFLIG